MENANAQDNNIVVIRNALGLNKSEYEIVHEDSFYVIQPNKNRQSHIASIISADIFRRYNLEFRSCVFENLHFTNETINKKIRFQRCIFKKCTLDRCIFEDFVNFNFGNLNGSCEGNFVCTDTIFKNIAYFIKLTFNGNVDFSRSHFKERAFFSETTFKNKANFTEVIFDNNAYFDKTDFKKEANFSLSEFKQNAHFYGTYFNEFPNFIQAIFNENINFTNTELDFGFEVVKNETEEAYKKRKEEYDKKQDKEDKKEPKKYKIANEFRDSFRSIKGLLIENHNMLDASQFHRVELYCKEIELEHKRKEGLEKSTTRDFVDRIQLMFYRLTSDHHTDLLLILNNMLALIILFGAFVYGLCCFASHDKIKENDVERTIYYLHSLMTNPFCFECNMGNFVWSEIIAILALCLTFAIAFMLMVAMFYCINTKCKHLGRWFVVIFLINAIILAIKPAIMLPLFGKLIDESLKIDFPALTSLSIIYAILMFLLIWSLQKTARKNTIVPN